MKHYRTIHSILAILVLITTQLACQAIIPPTKEEPTPTAPPAKTSSAPSATTATETAVDISQFSDEEIMTGIQFTLDDYADAYANNKPDLITYLVDQTNKPFRRIVRSRFDEFQKSSQAGQVRFSYKLLSIERRDFGYVIGHFETRGGYNASWVFRYHEDHWVISEPTVEQVGEPVIIETEFFTYTTYPWAEDINGRIIELVEEARQNVKDVLGKVPDEKANVFIMPIYGLRPGSSSGAIASYSRGQGIMQNVIQIYTPNSYAYSFYDPAIGWDGDLLTTLTHEYTHMTHAISFDQAGAISDWMSEGLAEFVAGQTENKRWACQSAKSGTLIPIIDETDTIYKQDLMHMYSLERDFSLSYDFATSLVDYTVETHGGLDGFWKLANALDDTSNLKKAVQQAYGIPYEKYDQGWQAWLLKQC